VNLNGICGLSFVLPVTKIDFKCISDGGFDIFHFTKHIFTAVSNLVADTEIKLFVNKCNERTESLRDELVPLAPKLLLQHPLSYHLYTPNYSSGSSPSKAVTHSIGLY
jgi:hypothetical protein